MTVYLSGPMSGKKNYNFEAFFEAERVLTSKGFSVVNPARLSLRVLEKKLQTKIDDENYSRFLCFFDENDRHLYMREDIKAVLDVEAVVLLDGWHTSRGAIIEYKVATECGKQVFEYNSGGIKQLDDAVVGLKLSEKPRMELVDMAFVEGIAKVLTFGVIKYGDNSFGYIATTTTKKAAANDTHQR